SQTVNISAIQVERKECARVTLEPTALEAGKGVDVQIRFSAPANEEGLIRSQIFFVTDDKAQSRLSVLLRAYVTKTAGLAPPELAVDSAQLPGATLHQNLELVNVSDKPLKALYAAGPLQGPRITVPRDAIAPGQRAQLILNWILPTKA